MSDYDLDSVDVNVENGTAMNRNGDHSRSGTMVGRSPGRGTTMGGARKTSQISTPGKKRSSVGVDYAKLEKYGSHAIGRQMSVHMGRGITSNLIHPTLTSEPTQNEDSNVGTNRKLCPENSNLEELSEETEHHEGMEDKNGTSHPDANGNGLCRENSTAIPLVKSGFGSEQISVEPKIISVEPNRKSSIRENEIQDEEIKPPKLAGTNTIDKWEIENEEDSN